MNRGIYIYHNISICIGNCICYIVTSYWYIKSVYSLQHTGYRTMYYHRRFIV